MADGTVNLGVDVLFFPYLLGKVFLPLRAFGFPVELGHELDRAEMWIWVSVTLNAPSHRKFFGLVDGFHLVNASVATLTTDA